MQGSCALIPLARCGLVRRLQSGPAQDHRFSKIPSVELQERLVRVTENGSLKHIQKLLSAHPRLVETRPFLKSEANNVGLTPLQFAALTNNEALAKALRPYKPDLNLADPGLSAGERNPKTMKQLVARKHGLRWHMRVFASPPW